MQISGHIVQHYKSEKGSQNTKRPRMFSKISTMERNFTALSNKAVAFEEDEDIFIRDLNAIG